MRQYTINNEFIYNESLREIISLHDKKVLKVTLMRARCLSYLFENAYKKLITREMISHAVWGERSQFVSDANLTQLLYLLRRDVLMAKLMNLCSKNKINPLIGSAGVSAVPMAARVSNKVGLASDAQNFLLMHAMGPNVAGVIGSAIAAGVMLKYVLAM